VPSVRAAFGLRPWRHARLTVDSSRDRAPCRVSLTACSGALAERASDRRAVSAGGRRRHGGNNSVTRANVRLVSWGVRVASQVTYDDAPHTITVDPMGMLHARNCMLSISGLTSHGQAVAAKQAAFETTINPAIAGTCIDSGTSTINGVTGYVINSQSISSYDDMGREVRSTYYADPGPDGVWSTADDVVSTTASPISPALVPMASG
jgi:hypothetical protein